MGIMHESIMALEALEAKRSLADLLGGAALPRRLTPERFATPPKKEAAIPARRAFRYRFRFSIIRRPLRRPAGAPDQWARRWRTFPLLRTTWNFRRRSDGL